MIRLASKAVERNGVECVEDFNPIECVEDRGRGDVKSKFGMDL
jgi:hypothetical protein